MPPPTEWQLHAAKARLSELLDRAQTEGPQAITRHGKRRAVVLCDRDYQALVVNHKDFRAYLLGGPKVRSFATPRSSSRGRDVKL
ncbi:MAG TPA: type II toxin-antitoxin system Phd/YefM family antitoxin [Terriglobales bacterium]|nr:type II toxin-antitoxin system Phd/YefM family antitoxin [Terriglobales bacterium]